MNISTIQSSPGKLDTRSDLGYGTSVAKFHKQRQRDVKFPYIKDSEPTEEFEGEEEFIDSINKKSLNYQKSDQFANWGTTPFYFVAGNTKLSDCFLRPDNVLKEIAAFSNSIAPMGYIYKKPKTSLTGYSAAYPVQGSGGGTYRRTGELQGWSKPHRKIIDDNEEEEFYSLYDLSKIMLNDE